ncbi:MAG TPA: LysM peptidoglycan-binding domain-containing protein [Desulfuromonadales bacterium]|nr:LysM peptidoglycan-binding domain-containing protein [Desulfuromonadales bacterium]
MLKYGYLLVFLMILAGCAVEKLPMKPAMDEMAEQPTPAVSSSSVRTPAVPGSLPAVPDDQFGSEKVLPVDVAVSVEESRLRQTDSEKELLDAETLADNRVLQGEDQNPPAQAGPVREPQEPDFDFPVVENDQVLYFVDYYTGRARKTFQIWLERSARYLPMMQEIFAEAGLPRDLAYLAMVESGFNDKAYSWAHAVGPWQFIESTGRRYGLDNNWWFDERRDPERATRAAASFLADLHASFDGNWYLAVASYNAGPGKLRRAIRMYGTRDFWEISSRPFLRRETKNFVPKLLAVLLISRDPGKYGFTDLDWQEPLAYDTYRLPSSTDLEMIARLCGTDYATIKQLNPELKRWSTPPGIKNYQVRIPAGTAALFGEKYAQLPAAKRANYLRHEVRSGDTLLALAKRYGVRVSDIERLNSIDNPRALQIGDNLVLPLNPDYDVRVLAELKDDYQRSRRTSYTVRTGDSLWKISRKFDVTEKQLRVWNRLGWSNVIRPGQRLIVSARAGGAGRSQAVAKNSPQGPERKLVYLVRSGDTLWDIGRQFSVNTAQIRAWNNLDKDHILQPGQKLTLLVRGQASG